MKAEVPPGYKQTEVGVIPEDWEASTIGENSKWMSGGTPRRNTAEFWSGAIPWISGSTLKTLEISTSDQFLTADAVAAGSKMAPVNSTLLLVRGSALHNEIRAGLVVLPVAFNQDVKALVPNATVEPKFLTYYIMAQRNELLALVSSAGNSAGVLDTALVQHYKFLKPPLPEQRAIAAALSGVDGLLAKLDQLIAKKRDLKQAAMQQLLTGQIRLPGAWRLKPGYKQTEVGVIPEDWDAATIGQEVTFSGGSQPPRFTFRFSPTEGYIRLIQIRDYKTDEYASFIPDSMARKRCTATDIMIGRYGPPVFQILRGIEGAYNVALIKATPSQRISNEFLFNVLNQEKLFQIIDSLSRRSSGQTGVDMPALKAYGLPLPSLPEQTAIAEVLSEMGAELAALEQEREKTCALKLGMMQELLTGRIRLV